MRHFSADVVWFRNGTMLESSPTIETTRVQNSHFLTLFDSRREDVGEYECVAINRTGERWRTYNLHVDRKSGFMFDTLSLSSSSSPHSLTSPFIFVSRPHSLFLFLSFRLSLPPSLSLFLSFPKSIKNHFACFRAPDT